MNMGRRGASLSVGGRGSSMSFGSSGIYSNVGIPGTGISYRSKVAGVRKATNRVTATRGNQTKPDQVEVTVSVTVDDDGNMTIERVNGPPLTEEEVASAKKLNRDALHAVLQEECDKRNQLLDELPTWFQATPPSDTLIEFVKEGFELPAPVLRNTAEFAVGAAPAPPNITTPNLFGRLSGGLLGSTDAKNERIQAEYERKLSEWNAAQERYHQELNSAQAEFDNAMAQWEAEKKQFEEAQEIRRHLIESGRLTNPSDMEAFLGEMLHVIEWPRETVISFEVQDGGTRVMIDVDLPEIEDFPQVRYSLDKRNFRIVTKDLSQTELRRTYAQFIHGIAFRIIGEVFVALPMATDVVLSGFSQRPDKKTARVADEYLFSVRVSRTQWDAIDFGNISALDVSECFTAFDLKRDMSKSYVFSPVNPFT